MVAGVRDVAAMEFAYLSPARVLSVDGFFVLNVSGNCPQTLTQLKNFIFLFIFYFTIFSKTGTIRILGSFTGGFSMKKTILALSLALATTGAVAATTKIPVVSGNAHSSIANSWFSENPQHIYLIDNEAHKSIAVTISVASSGPVGSNAGINLTCNSVTYHANAGTTFICPDTTNNVSWANDGLTVNEWGMIPAYGTVDINFLN